jgi:hypothetical protein
MQKFDMERLSPKKLNEVEGKEQSGKIFKQLLIFAQLRG